MSGAVYSHWRSLLPAYFGGRGSGAGALGKSRVPRPLAPNPDPFLHSSLFRRPAAVVRDRGNILDRPDFDPGCGERTHRRFAAGTRPADPHFHHAQSTFTRLVGGGHGGLL